MTTIAEWYKVDGEHLAQSLNEIREKLSSAEGEAVLDFSSVARIDTTGLRAMEELAVAAQTKNLTVELRAVNVAVYKVLKLARLTPQFSFAS
jgi:anti-anti-sigma regulatory factor